MASGDTLLCIGVAQNEPPASAYATYDTRNGHLVLNFDTTTQETAIFSAVLPRHYAGGGITCYLTWCAATATTGTIGWDLAIERVGTASQDIDSDGWGSASTVTASTVNGTSGICSTTSVAISDLDSIAVGDLFRLRVRRDVANDTAAGDAQLIAVELKET